MFETEEYTNLISDPVLKSIVTLLNHIDEIPLNEIVRTVGISNKKGLTYLNELEGLGIVKRRIKGSHKYFFLAPSFQWNASEVNVIRPKGVSVSKDLHFSRKCYDHLAGKSGVHLTDSFIKEGYLVDVEDKFEITPKGESYFINILGIDIDKIRKSKRQLAGKCLDVSERKYHLSGILGASVLNKLQELNILIDIGRRKIVFTNNGEEKIRHLLALK